MRYGRLIGILTAIAFVIFLIIIVVPSAGFSEGVNEWTTMTVTATRLNGRREPRKTGIKEALFDKGDTITATGSWSDDHKWIEIIGGESGVVWCDIRYLTERVDIYKVKNTEKKTVKIRSKPFDGKITGYLKLGKTTTIYQTVLGWGRCSKGWINLFYVDEIDD